MRFLVFSFCAAFISAVPVLAQEPMTVVAVPQFSTPKNVPTSGEDTGVIARRVADVIASDLRSSGQLVALGADHTRVYSYWRRCACLGCGKHGGEGAGYRLRRGSPDGRVTVGCYLHDIASGQEMTRQGLRSAARMAPGRPPLLRRSLHKAYGARRLDPRRLCC
jgi:TolB protein